MPAGRPLKFKTKEELEKKIQAYFEHCKPHIDERPVLKYMVKETRVDPKTKKKVVVIREPKRGETYNHIVEGKEKYITEEQPLTVTGLAVFLGCDRDTLLNYSQKEEFFGTIKEAKDAIHSYAEKSLWLPKVTSGIIFNLKNNWGWKDQSEVLNRDIPTGFEHLSDEELNQKLEELRRKTDGGIPKAGNSQPQS